MTVTMHAAGECVSFAPVGLVDLGGPKSTREPTYRAQDGDLGGPVVDLEFEVHHRETQQTRALWRYGGPRWTTFHKRG